MKMQERIRRARRKAGLSQAALADLVKVRRSAVSNWESAKDVLPSMQNLVAIAQACRVSIEWLGTGRGGMTSDPEALADIPTADAELVDALDKLFAGFALVVTQNRALCGGWCASCGLGKVAGRSLEFVAPVSRDGAQDVPVNIVRPECKQGAQFGAGALVIAIVECMQRGADVQGFVPANMFQVG